MDKEERTNRAAKLKLSLERRNKTMYNKKRRKNDEGYPPKKYVPRKIIKTSHHQSTTTGAFSDKNADIDRYDNHHSDDDFENNDVAILSNGNGIKNDSSLHGNASRNNDVHHQNVPNNHEEGYEELDSTSKDLNTDISINQKQHDNMNKIDEEDKNSNMSMSERVFNWVKKYHALNKVTTDAGSVAIGGSVCCNQVKRSVSMPRNNVTNIDTDDDNNDNDDNNNDNYRKNINHRENDNKNSNNSNNSAKSDNNYDDIKEKNSSVLPLFFQHQGHSRTIIGTKSF